MENLVFFNMKKLSNKIFIVNTFLDVLPLDIIHFSLASNGGIGERGNRNSRFGAQHSPDYPRQVKHHSLNLGIKMWWHNHICRYNNSRLLCWFIINRWMSWLYYILLFSIILRISCNKSVSSLYISGMTLYYIILL